MVAGPRKLVSYICIIYIAIFNRKKIVWKFRNVCKCYRNFKFYHNSTWLVQLVLYKCIIFTINRIIFFSNFGMMSRNSESFDILFRINVISIQFRCKDTSRVNLPTKKNYLKGRYTDLLQRKISLKGGPTCKVDLPQRWFPSAGEST